MEERRRAGRRPQQFEDSVVQSDLKYWGYHKGKQYAAEGWAPANTLAQIMSGRTDNPGHRVLCLDLPAGVWPINSRVMMLPTDYVGALVARYCLPVERETGRPFDPSYLAELLGTTLPTYRKRLTLARAAYRTMLFAS